jgi:carbamoyl-phosphate synthase large subunit
MRSTGEVLGLADSFGLAFYKAQQATQVRLPAEGTVLMSVAERDKPAVVEVARRFAEMGFSIKATEGTHRCLAGAGIEAEQVLKMHEGGPNIVDVISAGEIQLVVNTPSGKESKQDDSYIRTTAVKRKVPYITTLAAALAAAKGIDAFRKGRGHAKSVQEYHAGIR